MLELISKNANALKAMNSERTKGDRVSDITILGVQSGGWALLEGLKDSLWEFDADKHVQDELLFFEEGTNVTLGCLNEGERYAVTFIYDADTDAAINITAQEVINLFDEDEENIELYASGYLDIYPMSSAKGYKEMLKYAKQ